jgi:exodeoxyribonuclease VII small subunit
MDERTGKRRGTSNRSSPTASWLKNVQKLSYQDARTAMELAMAQLQSDDLAVEEMASLYQRAEACAQRCQAVLEEVSQTVIEWEAQQD